MRCSICAVAELMHDTRELPHTYKGQSTAIAAVTGDYCPTCGENVLDSAQASRVSTAMLEFNKQVDASEVRRLSRQPRTVGALAFQVDPYTVKNNAEVQTLD